MTINVEHDTFLATVEDVRRVADELRAHRDQADREVDRMLDGGWSGRAAQAFGEGWLEWRRGSEDVLRGLAALGELLSAVHADLLARDVQSGADLDAVAHRIIERLT